MAAVAQWQSATLWMWMLWVRNPSAAQKNALNILRAFSFSLSHNKIELICRNIFSCLLLHAY